MPVSDSVLKTGRVSTHDNGNFTFLSYASVSDASTESDEVFCARYVR